MSHPHEENSHNPAVSDPNYVLTGEDHHIALMRPPPFLKSKPYLWFIQMESQFITAGITSDTIMYHTVVAALENDVLMHVTDIVSNPPEHGKYEVLKQRIIDSYGDSEEKKICHQLKEIKLGDKTPTQLLHEMSEIAGDRVKDSTLRSMWLHRLPSYVQAILSVTEEESLDKLSTLADKVIEVADAKSPKTSPDMCDAISGLDISNELDSRIKSLEEELYKLRTARASTDQYSHRYY